MECTVCGTKRCVKKAVDSDGDTIRVCRTCYKEIREGYTLLSVNVNKIFI